jgi:hypothetical protein
MPESTSLQFNFKSPAGSLLNIYASDADEAASLLGEMESLLGRVADIERVIGATSVVNSVIQNVPQQRPAPAQESNYGGGNAAGGRPRPGGPAPILPNGQEAEWKSGISKANKPYGGWYDPSTKSFIR